MYFKQIAMPGMGCMSYVIVCNAKGMATRGLPHQQAFANIPQRID